MVSPWACLSLQWPGWLRPGLSGQVEFLQLGVRLSQQEPQEEEIEWDPLGPAQARSAHTLRIVHTLSNQFWPPTSG